MQEQQKRYYGCYERANEITGLHFVKNGAGVELTFSHRETEEDIHSFKPWQIISFFTHKSAEGRLVAFDVSIVDDGQGFDQ